MMRLLTVAVLAACLAGCSGKDKRDKNDDEGGNEERGEQVGAGNLPPTLAWQDGGNGGSPIRTSQPRDPSLIPGDAVVISVYGEADLTLETRIPDSGKITFPLIGSVDAAGLSPDALEASIQAKLGEKYFVDPNVTVMVREFATRKVYILGGVLKPSGYEILPSERITLMQLISAAGGITDKAYKEHVQIVRRKGGLEREVINLSLVDVEKMVASGQAAADLELWPDDLVVIPSAARVVYVLGAVRQPGWFDIPSDTRMTASMAISRAGSFTKFAKIGSIEVLRRMPNGEQKSIEVDLDNVIDGELDQDVVLEPGDVVFVPERGLF